MGVENRTSAIRALRHLKFKYKLCPCLVTCDFSPALVYAVMEVFGEDVLQIDGFHVMQLLNNGIRKDLSLFRDKMFRAEIKELLTLRKWLNALLQALGKPKCLIRPVLEAVPSIDKSHIGSQTCVEIISLFLPLLTVESPGEFERRLKTTLKTLSARATQESPLESFCNKLKKKLPMRKLTIKGRKRLEQELLKKLKTLCLAFRKSLEEKKKEFSTKCWCLFFQPEKLTPARKQTLQEFLARYPSLQKYRKLTLEVGSIYRKDIATITQNEIACLKILPHYSEKLKTALKTLKKFQTSIYRFIGVFQKNPALSKACRSNTEFLNRNFKAPFKHGLGCVQRPHLEAKLSLQMGCEVRWFVKAS